MTPLHAYLRMHLSILNKPGLLVFSLTLLAATACNAPLVRSAGLARVPVEDFADGTRELEVEVSGGAHLRGVFTPAQASIPRGGLAIHFLPAGASLTTGLEGGFTGVKQSLDLYAARGWDSVMLDHRGVGASSGKLSPEQLASDAVLRAFSFELGEFSGRHVDRLPPEEEAFLDELTNR